MPIIANTTSGNTFSAVRSQLNLTTKRMNQFAVNESTLYANTINANVSLKLGGTDIRTTFAQNTYVKSILANTNAYIATKASWASVTGTNTALRTIISDRLQVANAVAAYVSKTLASPASQTVLSNMAFSANVSIAGRLTVTGGITSYFANNVSTGDNMIYLNANSVVSNPDLGFAGNYNDGVYHHAGFFRDASDAGTWKVFENYAPEPDAATAINTAHATFKLAPFSARDARFTGVLSVTANTTVGNTTVGGFLKLNGTDIRATFAQNTYVKSILANTNSYIASVVVSGATWTALLATNTALRTLINTKASWAALTGTNTALRTLISDRYQVANVNTLLANKASWTALTGTNTALRTLISDRLQVANASATYQTKTVERAALANTNLRVNQINTNLTVTNTALRALISDRLQVANSKNYLQVANAKNYLQTSNSKNYLQVANSKNYLQVANSKAYLQVANAVSTYATKFNPTTSGLIQHTGRMTISTNLDVSGNTQINKLLANGSLGTAGYALKTNGTSVYWDAVGSGSGSSSNSFTGILVGSNVVVADSTTDRLTFIAGSGMTISANPATDTITFASTATGGGSLITTTTKSLDALKGTDTIVTSVSGTSATAYLQVANAVSTYATKTSVQGPAFSAYAAAILQTITSGSQQKVLFQTEEFDTNNNFASSRFTPTVAGYYQLNAEVRLDGSSGTGEMMIVIWKNGSEYKRGTNQSGTQIASNFWAMQVSSLVYANGTGDYFEIYVQQGSGADRTITAVNSPNITYFNGAMVRGV